MDFKSHWEKVYTTKQINEVSWYQPTPRVSLGFINELGIPKDAAIIDVGGGDCFLVDHLLTGGYTNISVLDISEAAITRAKERLGEKARLVKWIACDINDFIPETKYDFWHDRAAFHFLTAEEEIKKYLATANNALSKNGKIVIGTFSEDGPSKCSGLPVKQYSEKTLPGLLKKWFQKIRCISIDHITPINTIQNFLFCSFKKSII
ncbi:MAG: class I SAM-dependent methyltransferase [Chitinophagaceae bacterium]